MNKRKLKEVCKYHSSYKGINFEISHHGMGEEYRPEGIWCYYLLIHEKQLPEEYRKDFILEPVFNDKGRLSHDYYETRISDLDWHCGITYYSKEGGADGEKIIIKMGCDYGHLYDENQSYNESILQTDVENTIDILFNMFPDIKIRSSYYGGYFKPNEGEFNEHGTFVAFSEKERWDKEHVKSTV